MTLELMDLVMLGLVATLGWYWFSGTRVRELAIAAARRAAQQADLQLLDQTVALSRVSMSRDAERRWRVWRQYRFEFSRDGLNRETGHVIMLGKRLQAIVISEPRTLH